MEREKIMRMMIWRFSAAFIACAILLTACGKTDGVAGNGTENESEADAETAAENKSEADAETAAENKSESDAQIAGQQKELYAGFIEELDQMLEENRELVENRRQEIDCGVYREKIGTVYIFSESFSGVLRADYGENGTDAFQIMIRDGKKNEKHRYDCRLLSDGSLWFGFQTESKSKRDLPDYIVNEDALRYSRVDYVYDDGMTDLEEERERRRQEAEQYLEDKIDGEVQEFWCSEDFLYRIDREEGLFSDAAADKESCIADFLRKQVKRLNCQLAVSEASLEVIEKYRPKGYSLLDAWNEIAVCDLNRDGRMDYVAAFYPDDYEEEQRYEGGSPYELSSQYYAAGFWMLLSAEDGGYEQIRLSDSIEYWESELVLVEVTFVDEGILQLEYFVGRAPFSNALLRFRYEEETKNFYMLRSYYRDSYNDALLIGDEENYGRTSIGAYFSGRPQNYCEGIWQSAEDNLMPGGVEVGYYSDNFQYRCENLLMEHRINSLIWEKEYELVQAFRRYCPDEEPDIMLDADGIFYSGRLVSGRVSLLHYGGERRGSVNMPVMIDRMSGEYVTVSTLIGKEEFLQIFTDWFGDAAIYGDITAEERKQYVEAIEACWEKADTVEHYFEEGQEFLSLQIEQEGVRVKVWSETNEQWESCLVEKEYFWGTDIWDYFEL